MGKFIGFIFVFGAVLIVWQATMFYSIVREPIVEGEKAAISYLQSQINIKNPKFVSFFNGTLSYYVVEGEDEHGEEVYVWVSKTLDSFVVKAKKVGLSIEDVEKFVYRELKPKSLIQINIGLENALPLYEIIYKDEKDRYSYYFISFIDGKYLKHYHLGM